MRNIIKLFLSIAFIIFCIIFIAYLKHNPDKIPTLTIVNSDILSERRKAMENAGLDYQAYTPPKKE